MSDKAKFQAGDDSHRTAFLNHLVDDLKALEILLTGHSFETGITRVGVEQEMCLIDASMRPALLALEMLQAIGDEHFTTELARFNLELNLDPCEFRGGCLGQMQESLERFLRHADETAQRLGARIILAGILPTIRDSDVSLEKMTPVPRYKALNDALRESRGSDFRFDIRGIDEFIASHETVLYEACNTSFQVHFQIDAERFASHYNWAQAIAAPVLSCATNSPLFLEKRLWRETRIALFQQSTDDRAVPSTHRRQRSRVDFGQHWEAGTIVDHFRELVSRYKVLLTPAIDQNSLDELRGARIPRLTALSLFNGTIYPWNRPCYGITNGKPHIRIESRYLPAGPTVIDEVANAALWLGLMNGMPPECQELSRRMRFESAYDNFIGAARGGLGAQFEWLDGAPVTATSLLLDTLLPIARSGLQRASIDAADIDRYLAVIERRVASGRTGSQWLLESVERLGRTASRSEAVIAATRGIYEHQQREHPVHEWPPCAPSGAGVSSGRWSRVEQLMSTDLVTVRPEEPIKLVKSVLLWSSIRHVPVEGDQGKLLGIISSQSLLERIDSLESLESVRAADVMDREPPTVTPDTPIQEAFDLMAARNLTCLPVLDREKLVGILTDRDCLKIVRSLLCGC